MTAQMCLPGFAAAAALASSKVKAVGVWGEQYAADVLERNGYRVTFTRQQSPGDLRVMDGVTGQVWRVEVKTARKGSDGAYQFCLYRKLPNRVCTDARRADVLILLAAHESGRITIFVIPADVVADRKQLKIRKPDGSTGKYAPYRRTGRDIIL